MNEQDKADLNSCKEFFKGKKCCGSHRHGGGGDSSILYCLGILGSLFYFLKDAPTFGAVLLGIGKSFVWPALIVFKVLTDLHI